MAQSQYATLDQLQALAITPANAGRFGASAMTAAIQQASSMADSYLTSQFTLPLQTSPQGWDMALTGAVCSIAAYLLFKRVGFSPQAPGDELITKLYQEALIWLGQVRDEKIFPQYTDSSGTTPVLEAGPYIISDPPVGFTQRGITNSVNCTNGWPWGW